ncbi:MAG: hypothetical protein ACKVZ6_00675 [Kineosporiaceae bacterium]
MTVTDTAQERVERLRRFEAVLRRDVRLVVEATLDALDAEAPHWRRGTAGPLTRGRLTELARVVDARLGRLLHQRVVRLGEEYPAADEALDDDPTARAFLGEYRSRLDVFLRDALAAVDQEPCPPPARGDLFAAPVTPAGDPAETATAGEVAATVQHLDRLRRRLAPDAEDLAVR